MCAHTHTHTLLLSSWCHKGHVTLIKSKTTSVKNKNGTTNWRLPQTESSAKNVLNNENRGESNQRLPCLHILSNTFKGHAKAPGLAAPFTCHASASFRVHCTRTQAHLFGGRGRANQMLTAEQDLRLAPAWKPQHCTRCLGLHCKDQESRRDRPPDRQEVRTMFSSYTISTPWGPPLNACRSNTQQLGSQFQIIETFEKR